MLDDGTRGLVALQPHAPFLASVPTPQLSHVAPHSMSRWTLPAHRAKVSVSGAAAAPGSASLGASPRMRMVSRM